MKVHLDVMMELLQESEKDHGYRWTLQKRVKWNLLEVKLKHRMNTHWRKEKLKGVELKWRLTIEGGVHFCEPREESLVGEDVDKNIC
jgi:hypothetical protein